MTASVSCRAPLISMLAAILVANSSGCLVTRVKWVDADYVASPAGLFGSKAGLDPIDRIYATALEQEQNGWACCVDSFFEVAIATSRHQTPTGCDCPLRRLHQSALNKLVVAGQQHGRLDPRSGLTVRHRGERTIVPITHHGFVWRSADFERLIPVGEYKTNGLSTLHRRTGVGIPLVVASSGQTENAFVVRRPTFAATLRMNVSGSDQGGQPADGFQCRLELYDPLRMDETLVQGHPQPIAKDLSAPLAYRLRNDPQTILADFINPGSASGETELRSIEPYQPGKIPVVFVHGILSNPYTWAEMINELQANPGFVDHFQIWLVEYPTGQPFLTSAAECRQRLCSARHTFDPHRADGQLSNMILVGHSMGGLVSKLQVTSSGDRLWGSIANRPFEQVTIAAEFRQEMAEAFFFEPSSDVTRVVFIGTPHRGSGTANRLIGRLGSALVAQPADRVRAHRQLIRCNPGVFRKGVRRRIPTSIDLLEPRSELLNAIADLPVKLNLPIHSIIGNRCLTICDGRSDGVVSVKSARDQRAATEQLIRTRHTRLTSHRETVRELTCILRTHLQETKAKFGPTEGATPGPDETPVVLQAIADQSLGDGRTK